ncbi:MAG: ATP-binding cassette domain-containing protein [Pseudomonadota bacterium]
MSAVSAPYPSGSGRKGVRMAQLFKLDAIFDGLTSGRLCGQKFDPETAQIILILLERLEWIPDARQLASALPHFPSRFSINQLRSTLSVLGFKSTEETVKGNSLRRYPNGTVIEKNGLWLLEKNDQSHRLFRPSDDDEETETIVPNKAYRLAWFERASHTDDVSPGSWTGRLLGRFTPELRLLIALTFLSGLSAILIAFGITTLFDTVIPTRNYATLAGILLGLGAVFVFDFTFRSIRADIVGRVSGRLEYVLGGALLDKLMGLPAVMLSGSSLGDQMARLRQFESIRDLFGGPVVVLMLELPLALLLLLTVAIIAWPLAAMLAAYAVVFATIAFLLAPAIRRASQNQSMAQSKLNRVVLEVLEQRHRIGRDGLAPIWLGRVDAHVRDLAHARRRAMSLSRWLDGLSQASLPMAAGSVIGVGALFVIQGSLTGGSLIAATILSWRLFAPVQQGLVLLPKLQNVLGLFKQIDALMRMPEEESGSEQGNDTGGTQGNLVAKSLVLRYPKSIAPALAGVQFSIPHGAFFTVSGPSGAGKTTLLKVLAGQLQPQVGAVLFNDTNLSQMSRAFRARNIAYVSQSPLYIYGSVAQNLRLSDPTADDDQLISILNELGLTDWIESLPNGIDTRLDPSIDHSMLPASVMSSLAVAQALLTQPAVLLMDEAAGSMDSVLEEHLLAALEARRATMTSVLVTHRPSLIRRSDKAILLNAGAAQVVETQKEPRQAS